MIVLILPGFSKHNRAWMMDLKKYLEERGVENIIAHEWNHWSSGAFGVKKELERIYKEIACEKVCIVAKSVGTRVAMKIIEKDRERIGRMVLCGIPTKGESKNAWDNYSPLSDFAAERVVVFQNKKDPLASYENVSMFVKKINKGVKVIEKNRSDHDYPFFEDIYEFIARS